MLPSRFYPLRPLIVFVLVAALALPGCQRGQQTPPDTKTGAPSSGVPGDAGTQMALGNPSNASTNLRDADNYLVARPQYVLSYNRAKGGPNWASWHVEQADLGSVERSNKFAPDPDLPPDWQIRPNDYTRSGYDRGHVCPSGDRTASPQDNDATFYMSNMLPQEGDLNRHAWEELESYCRTLVRDGNELYIVAGGYGSKERIGRGKINVPTNCWKIIAVLPQGDNDLSRMDSGTLIIAVDMPNRKGIVNDDWQKYLTTVAGIESATGYRFFTGVPAAVQSVLKNQMDSGRVVAGGSSSFVERSANRRPRRDSRRRQRKRRERD